MVGVEEGVVHCALCSPTEGQRNRANDPFLSEMLAAALLQRDIVRAIYCNHRDN